MHHLHGLRFCVFLAVLLLIAGCRAEVDVAATPEPQPAAVPANAVAETVAQPDEEPEPTVTAEASTAPTSSPTATPSFDSTPAWQVQGFLSELERAVAFRFNVDAGPDPLGQIFFREDEGAASELAECFDDELRSVLGNDRVDGFEYEAADAPQLERVASDVLFACVPADRIRQQAIWTRLDGWNLYGRPSAVDRIAGDDPCIQELYPSQPAAFRAAWLDHLGDRDLDPYAGTCLAETQLREFPMARDHVGAATHTGKVIAGRRGLTMQWISWEPDEWGTIEFRPLGDERYEATGRQDGPDGDFVSVAGFVTRISDTKLILEGSVITRVSYINGGAICVRYGDISFRATAGRQFWRMQDLLNCDEQTTDYVDIYFG